MTSHPQPCQYLRCGTNKMNCPKKHSDLTKTRITGFCFDCASHSNTINQQDDPCIDCIHIKKEIQDAREKVLDELTKLREKGEYCLGIFHKLEEYERLWREEWDWIKSLRTTKGDVKTP